MKVHFGMTSDEKSLCSISDRKTNRDYDKDVRPGLYVELGERAHYMEVIL